MTPHTVTVKAYYTHKEREANTEPFAIVTATNKKEFYAAVETFAQTAKYMSFFAENGKRYESYKDEKGLWHNAYNVAYESFPKGEI